MTKVIDSIRWQPRARVDKYDDDMVAFAARKSGILVPDGDTLARYCKAWETIEAEGNLLTTAGLTRLTALFTAAGGTGLTNTTARLGVGDSSTAAAVGDTDLGAASGSTHRQFEVMAATYPQTSGGVLTLQSAFSSGEANFAWNEWGTDIGTATVAAGTTVNACFVNHKIQSLGTKASGTWTLTATITIS